MQTLLGSRLSSICRPQNLGSNRNRAFPELRRLRLAGRMGRAAASSDHTRQETAATATPSWAAPGSCPRQGLRLAPPFFPPPPHLSLHPLIPLFFLLLPNSSHLLLLCSSLFSLCLLDPRTLLDLLFRQVHAVAMYARPSASELLPSPFFCPSSANRTLNLALLLSPSPACLSLHSTDLWSPLPGNASLVGKSQALVCGTELGEGNRNSKTQRGRREGRGNEFKQCRTFERDEWMDTRRTSQLPSLALVSPLPTAPQK